MFSIDPDTFMPFLVFSIPIIAIVGGITVAIVKSLGRQRLIELAQQERIAAIQRGLDVSKLPPLPSLADDDDLAVLGLPAYERDRRRSQGTMIGGLITLFAGIGVMAFLMIVNGGDRAWAVGLIPGMVGVALLISAWIMYPKSGPGPGAGGH